MSAETELLTPLEAARYVRVHRETLYDLIRSGTIRASKVGGRWRIPKANLDSYLHKDTGSGSVAVQSDTVTNGSTSQRQSLLRHEQQNIKTILVVDDDPLIRDLFQVALNKRGHTVTAAANGHEAIERIKHENYDLIFIDLVMPEFDGVETLQAIREIDPDPTIVLVTGYPDGELVAKALALGPFVLLAKPVRITDLLKVVEG